MTCLGAFANVCDGLQVIPLLSSPPPPYFSHSLAVSFPSQAYLEMPATQAMGCVAGNMKFWGYSRGYSVSTWTSDCRLKTRNNLPINNPYYKFVYLNKVNAKTETPILFI